MQEKALKLEMDSGRNLGTKHQFPQCAGVFEILPFKIQDVSIQNVFLV